MDSGNFIPTSWVPVTPVKPIFPKPPPICTEEAPNQHGQTTWFLQEKYSDGFAPETQAQRIVSEATFRTNSQLLPGGERRFSDLMDPDRLRNFPFTGLIALADASVSNSAEVPAAFTSNSANIPPTLGSNPSRVGSFQSGENSIPSRPIYDLNSPPLAEEDEFLSMGHPSWFAPLTPGPPKTAEKFQGNLHSSIVNERTERHGNEVCTTILDVEEFQCGKEHLQRLEDSSNSHKELQENHHPGVDLNQTPPQKARRKKHRPKVVIEGQPKKTPNTRTPVQEERTPTVKRKYVRKSAIKETMATATVEVTRDSNGENTTMRETRSCRRKLNYEFDTTSNIMIGQGMKEKTQLGVSYDNTSPLGKEFEEFVLKSEKQVPSSQNPVKTDLLHELRSIQDEARRGKCRIVFSDETHDKQGKPSAPRSSNESNYSRSTSLVLGEKALGSKRAHLCTNGEAEVGQTDVIEGYSSSVHQFPSSSPLWFENNGNRSIYFPAIYKKKRTEKVHFASSSNTYCTENAANSNARQPIPWRHMSNASVALYTPGANCRYSANQLHTSTALETGSLIDDQGKQQLFYLGQRMTRKRSKGSTRPRDMTSQTRLLEFREFPTFQSGGASTGLHMQSCKISNQYGTCMEALVADHHTTLTTKKRTKRSFSARSANAVAIWNQTPSIDEIVERLRRTDINCQGNRVISSEQGALVPYNFRYERANALVVYQRDGTLVPYGGSFNPLKKRKPRPKVEIDEETDRVWKLLLENINSEGIDGTDEEKAKWWEDERSVFQGRADSFIARMHLVQGDRRFSPWKGSVLDSVVGVFLTQNVSDHLSSSAFMALAAKYPLKAKGNNSRCSEQTSTLSKELEVCILNTGGSNKLYKEKSSQSTCSGSPLMTHQTAYTVEKESVDSNESHKSSTSGNGLDTHAKSAANREEATSSIDNREMDGVFLCNHSDHSLLNSLEPSMATAERERSCLDPEADKITSSPRSSYRSSFMQLLQEAETLRARKLPIFEENFSSEQFSVLVEESLSSEISKKNEENCTSEQSGETAESVSQAETRKIAITSTESPNSYSEISHACSSPDRTVNKDTLSYNWPMWNPRANVSSETQDRSCVMQQVVEAPNLSTETLDVTASSVIDDLKNTANKELESVLKDDDYLPGKAIDETNSNRAQLKTGRMRKQKHKINWDSLRLQAQSEGKTRERSENTMDSLDWEAVRHADVNEIAYTIRERGMNNMLAERIKDFLNRLVKEHGSTDLEWLRDVPPDKAKEYLLSIRGLGLKSVECVRLLTLHHLAFPVDTNVGRIAVRLGWVPLQPLPESLQLHLLELYPVLESIQKYLWPRLCKLDQRTLYELHYQMITFGKVFCTKSKPNCNACPMRGECRHFASAFASARLSLPGPEEKGIVCSSQTKESNHAPVDIIKPLQLTPAQADGHLQGEQQLVKMSEPVIEIPSTPEPIVEVPATPEPEEPNILECDIEDAFYEDHDEIPTIKLNIEQFAQNLQNYMQHNMELQEGEMSRALVSLTPDAASIPMPKLKNVNRLRTEHLVYELPDSHPLLEGLDKREPDDPCSYLLAIWTPGEMADSIQPPDSNCSSRENGTLCDEPRCFSCNSIREANNQTVRGTLLIPCRTAMRGSFPLNGTYFQVNEVFADHQSSIRPIDVPRGWLWNLPRRTVYFGTSIPTIFKGFSTESIQYCFWRGFVCVRGFDQQTRSPRPLMARLHFPASKLPRTRGQTSEKRE